METSIQPGKHCPTAVMWIARALAIGTLSTAAWAQTDTHTDPVALVEHLQALRAEVTAQQSSTERYNPELLTALQHLSEALLAANALDETEQTLEQQIQLVKINDGLYTDQQLPFIFQQLGIFAARGEWDALADRVQYVIWLLDRTADQSPDERLQIMKQTRDWVRLLLLQGPHSEGANHLMQWRALEHSAITLGQEAGLGDEAMQKLIYDAALAELYIALGIVTPGQTSQQLIHRSEGQPLQPMRTTSTRVTTVSDIEAIYGARTSTVIDRAFHNMMGRHRQLVDRLVELNEEHDTALEDNDPESAAMFSLYLGDAVLLRQQYEPRRGTHINPRRGTNSTGSAARHYEEAWELLLQAGYDAETLNRHFGCPALLPLAEFSLRLSDQEPACQLEEDGSMTLPAFAATRNGIPGLPYSGLPDNHLISAPEGTATTITFQVGLNGQTDRLSYGESSPDNTSSRIRGRDILHGLQFRPALRDGRPVRAENIRMQIISLESG